MLKIENLEASYQGCQALHGVNLSLKAGEVACLIGRNGVGKTSTMRSIVQDTITVTKGTMEFQGRSLVDVPSHEIIKLGIGYVPEDRRVFANLTVFDNLMVPRKNNHSNAPIWTVEKVFELFPQLGEYRKRLAGVMSGGEQQMLSIARSLLTNPKLLLLDEPHEGLAPKIAEEVVDAIIELKKEGVSMIISEQALHTIKKCADTVHVIDKGCSVWNGSVREFYASPEVAEKYLMVR